MQRRADAHGAAGTGAAVAGAAAGGAGSPAGAAARAAPALAVLLLVRVPRGAVPWLLGRLVRGPRALAAVPGLRLARVLGSGHNGGFGLRPGFDRGGLFALFDDADAATAFTVGSPLVAAYRAHADEMLIATLRATSSRGSWGGVSMAVSAAGETGMPLAVLTRASIRPHHALAFWRQAAPSQAALAAAPGCRLAVGLGEAPLLRQATFSLWDDAGAVEAYARRGAHGQAAAAARRGDWFSESMFLRLRVESISGRWAGRTHG
jgi:spheroidene monooxygenase